MKKLIAILLCLAVAASAAGCGTDRSAAVRREGSPGVRDVLNAGMEQSDREKSGADEPDPSDGSGIPAEASSRPEKEPAELPVSSEEPDIDLTALSSTMVYSEVYGMLLSPEDYIGKRIKMDGMFSVYHDDAAGNWYFACIIQDAAACCAQGIEFELGASLSYPEDYPEEGSEICVSGIFDTYKEGDYTYCVLRDAVLLNG